MDSLSFILASQFYLLNYRFVWGCIWILHYQCPLHCPLEIQTVIRGNTGIHLSGITIHYCQIFICLKTLFYVYFYLFHVGRKIYPQFSLLDLGIFVHIFCMNFESDMFSIWYFIASNFPRQASFPSLFFCILLYNTRYINTSHLPRILLLSFSVYIISDYK